MRLREKNKQGSRERDIKITEEKGLEKRRNAKRKQHENQGKRRGRSISSGVSAVFSSTL